MMQKIFSSRWFNGLDEIESWLDNLAKEHIIDCFDIISSIDRKWRCIAVVSGQVVVRV